MVLCGGLRHSRAATLIKRIGDEQVGAAKAKGSVALGPLPNLLGSVPEAQQGDAHRGEGGLVGPECRRDAGYVTPSVSLEQ